jgi:CxxC motif-containing protein
MKRELTCIVCPLGCKIEVGFKDGDPKTIEYVKGNTCKRGEVYAKNECTHPVRVLTTTVACNGGGVVSVKTDKAIPKEKLFACMELVNNVKVDLPIHIGDVIIENVAGTDANIVAAANREA